MESDASQHGVTHVTIGQATAVTLHELFISRTFVCLVKAGEKTFICPAAGTMTAVAGDVVVFPAGALVTIENRPARNADYRAEVLFFRDDLVAATFGHPGVSPHPVGAAFLLPRPPAAPGVFAHVAETLNDDRLPDSIRHHRLMEPLIWLRDSGLHLPAHDDGAPLRRLRALLETDLAHPWRASEVAGMLAMSEPTFRRWLARHHLRFSVVLRNARLEQGLLLLQTSARPISDIALNCGFRTPSHFAEAFGRRFGHPPRAIRQRHD